MLVTFLIHNLQRSLYSKTISCTPSLRAEYLDVEDLEMVNCYLLCQLIDPLLNVKIYISID